MIQIPSSHSDRYGSYFFVYRYGISSCSDNILGMGEKSKSKNSFLLGVGCVELNSFQNGEGEVRFHV